MDAKSKQKGDLGWLRIPVQETMYMVIPFTFTEQCRESLGTKMMVHLNFMSLNSISSKSWLDINDVN